MGRAKASGGSPSRRKPGVQKYNLKTRIVGQLRRLFLWHPDLKKVRDRTRVARGLYRCDGCKGEFGPREMRCDHILPVVDVGGFEDWNTYIDRLFGAIPDGIQHICIGCHKDKTASERKVRNEARHKQQEAS